MRSSWLGYASLIGLLVASTGCSQGPPLATVLPSSPAAALDDQVAPDTEDDLSLAAAPDKARGRHQNRNVMRGGRGGRGGGGVRSGRGGRGGGGVRSGRSGGGTRVDRGRPGGGHVGNGRPGGGYVGNGRRGYGGGHRGHGGRGGHWGGYGGWGDYYNWWGSTNIFYLPYESYYYPYYLNNGLYYPYYIIDAGSYYQPYLSYVDGAYMPEIGTPLTAPGTMPYQQPLAAGANLLQLPSQAIIATEAATVAD